MGEGYWDLFWQTGAPEFYLRARSGPQGVAGAGVAVPPPEAEE